MGKGVRLTIGGSISSPEPFINTSPIYATAPYIYGVKDYFYTGHGITTLPGWTVINNSTIVASATGGIGVYLGNGGGVTNASTGSIRGSFDGVRIGQYPSAASLGIVYNAGYMSGATNIGADVFDGAVTNAVSGTIEGGYAAVRVTKPAEAVLNVGTLIGTRGAVVFLGSGSLHNIGTIENSTIGPAVKLSAGGTVTNSVGAVIFGYAGGIAAYTASASVSNFGAVHALDGSGLNLNAGGTATNSVNGYITGNIGINVAGGGMVANFGTVIGAGTDAIGVDLPTGGGVTNYNTISGSVIVGIAGVEVLGSGTVINNNSAVISGSTAGTHDGVELSGFAGNYGSIGAASGIMDLWSSVGGTTVSPTVRNWGTVNAVTTGISISGPPTPAAQFANYGAIVASDGVVISGLATAENSGTIKGLGSNGSLGRGVLLSQANGAVSNASGGYVFGQRYGVAIASGSATTKNTGILKGAVGFSSYGPLGYNNTLLNYGTIIGTGGTAVTFGAGANRLVVGPGAAFGGVVAGAGGSDTLELAFGTSAGTLSGLGSTFQPFASIVIDPAANWYLDGYNTNKLTSLPASITNYGTLNVRPGGSLQLAGSVNSAVTLRAASTFTNVGSLVASAKYSVAAVVVAAAGGSVTNRGTIGAVSALGSSLGVTLRAQGQVTNGSALNATASISAYNTAVDLAGTGSTLVNYATLSASSTAVNLAPGDLFENIAGPARVQASGVGVSFQGGSVSNDGAIVASGVTGVGISANGAGTIVNGAIAHNARVMGTAEGMLSNLPSILSGPPTLTVVNDGTLQGGIGVQAYGATRLVNAGTIIGSGGTAVNLTGINDVVAVAPGAKFLGSVVSTLGNTLELMGGAAGTLTGVGVNVTGFATMLVDTGAIWDLAGSATVSSSSLINYGTLQANAGDDLSILTSLAAPATGTGAIEVFPGGTIFVGGSVAAGETLSFATATGGDLQIADADSFAGRISGFAPGATIDLVNIAGVTGAGVQSGALTVRAAGTIAADLNVTGDFTGEQIRTRPDAGAGTLLTVASVACFAAGTRVLTARGEIPVEALGVGELVPTLASGRLAKIRWIGHRRVDLRHHPHPETLYPVRIMAGAFAHGRPHRNLYLSPDHSVFIDGVLIPARCLANGRSVAQERVREVTYFHIELPAHAVILADGLACESYLDTGNRCAFEDGGPALALHPDFALEVWLARACAPQITHGPVLERVRARLEAAGSQGAAARTKRRPGRDVT